MKLIYILNLATILGNDDLYGKLNLFNSILKSKEYQIIAEKYCLYIRIKQILKIVQTIAILN